MSAAGKENVIPLRRKVTDLVWPPKACPRCGGELQHHSLSAWCLACGWGKNRTHEPGKCT